MENRQHQIRYSVQPDANQGSETPMVDGAMHILVDVVTSVTGETKKAHADRVTGQDTLMTRSSSLCKHRYSEKG
ncbi:MAG: hypothetical protein FWD81_04160 [Methanomassiliicoccaceae archaeon]|nr:hypothetical protein [Methanomassiliicoccaceae archaeon]